MHKEAIKINKKRMKMKMEEDKDKMFNVLNNDYILII
tara:strand:+ start:558 stop:668 length:111 start_codon:yes stop_codon:yes gene_type:complete